MSPEPDALANRRLPVVDSQPTVKQISNSERHNEFHLFVVRRHDSDDTVSVPRFDCLDGPGRPAVEVVGRFPGMETVVVHTSVWSGLVVCVSSVWAGKLLPEPYGCYR